MLQISIIFFVFEVLAVVATIVFLFNEAFEVEDQKKRPKFKYQQREIQSNSAGLPTRIDFTT